MIVITAIDGVLRVRAEIQIPNAPHGQWSPARIGKLVQAIADTVRAAELVDQTERLVEEANVHVKQVDRRRTPRIERIPLTLVKPETDDGFTVGIGQRERRP